MESRPEKDSKKTQPNRGHEHPRRDQRKAAGKRSVRSGEVVLVHLFGGVGRIIRTILVKDTIVPVVTLLGVNPLLITNVSNLPIVDPGATVFEICDQGISVIASNGVNVNYPGTYAITYRATDASGNTGTKARTVIVSLPPAPGDQQKRCGSYSRH